MVKPLHYLSRVRLIQRNRACIEADVPLGEKGIVVCVLPGKLIDVEFKPKSARNKKCRVYLSTDDVEVLK